MAFDDHANEMEGSGGGVRCDGVGGEGVRGDKEVTEVCGGGEAQDENGEIRRERGREGEGKRESEREKKIFLNSPIIGHHTCTCTVLPAKTPKNAILCVCFIFQNIVHS